jgi:hypothetical protein
MSELSADPKARLMAAIQRAPSPTRRASQVWMWLVVPAGVFIAAALYFAFDGIEHGKGRALWFYVTCAVSWTAVAIVSLWGALGRARATSWRSRSALVAFALGTPAVLFATMFIFAVADPDVTTIHPEKIGYKCLGLTLAAAAFPLVALLYAKRESDPVHPSFTGAALGSACGAAAGIMVELWCPVAAPRHVAFGHILPIMVLAGLGALLGARILGLHRPARR